MILCPLLKPPQPTSKYILREVSEMHPHLIPMAINSLDCPSQGCLCLNIAFRSKLNTKRRISDRLPEIRKRTKSSTATCRPGYESPLFNPPMSYRKSLSSESSLDTSCLSASESSTRTHGWSGRHHGMCCQGS